MSVWPDSATTKPPSQVWRPRLDGVRVLVVDDDGDARELLCTVLEHRGASVVSAANVLDAIALVVDSAPEVVVSDIAMPDEDGFSLVRRVRALGAPQGEIPVIAVTAYAGTADHARALEAGFDAYLSKPVDLETLIGTIARHAEQRRNR